MEFERETPQIFEGRKQDHLRIALDPAVQATVASQFEQIVLHHEALPDFGWQEIEISAQVFKRTAKLPLLISSMTAGHAQGIAINEVLAQAAQKWQIPMGVGSQRRELTDPQAAQEWRRIRLQAPHAQLFGNLGIAQLIRTPIAEVARLVDHLEASAMIIHLNALQECIQPEGTPQFRGGFQSLQKLAKQLPVPVIVKETGCGFSASTLDRLNETGVAVVDVSGLGGTHWGRVEGERAGENTARYHAAQTFKNWGVPTVESLMTAVSKKRNFAVWASGGVRSGLEIVKLLAVGAELVGLAQPILAAVLAGKNQEQAAQNLETLLAKIEFEMRTALFCVGRKNLRELTNEKVWRWQQK